MIQSHIFITQGPLDILQINEFLTYNFFINGYNFGYLGDVKNVDFKDFFITKQSVGQVLVRQYEKKEDFTKDIMSLYKKYSQPTLLFLGDLSSYSEQMQEGMLKLLEEPPENLHIILYSMDSTNLLQTIKSRVILHTLPREILFAFLDAKISDKVKKKLPVPKDFINSLLNKNLNSLPDLKDVEREELDMWLWQISMYLDEFYKLDQNASISNLQEKIIHARLLNQSNLQKKFTIANLLF